MRGALAKRLRKFAKLDTPDLTSEVVYTKITTGQDYKRTKGLPLNETTVMDECQRQYYQLLKRIWKKAAA